VAIIDKFSNPSYDPWNFETPSLGAETDRSSRRLWLRRSEIFGPTKSAVKSAKRKGS
jgi:hypothetical protein